MMGAEDLVNWTSFLETVPTSFVSQCIINNFGHPMSILPDYCFRAMSTREFIQNSKI